MHFLAGIVLTILGAATAAPVDVHVRLSPPEIPYYRQAAFTIQVDAPANVEVRLPDMKKKFGGIEVYGEPKQSTTILEDKRRRTQVTYVLDPVKPGDYRIEPVEVAWDKDGRAEVASPGLRVRDLTLDETESLKKFEPIALPASRTGFLESWIVWAVAVGLLAILAVAFALYFLRRRSKHSETQAPRPPWDVARDRLGALEARGLASSGQFGPFYVELSDILRRYMEDRFHLHAPERTTPEFLGEAASCGIFSPEHQLLLEKVLRHADRVKFARHEPGAVEMEQDFLEVRRFVEETVPRVATPAGEVAA